MSSDRKILTVTRPSLPPFEDMVGLLREIWDSGWLTNGGPFHERLEAALADYLGVKHISLFSNGTIGLITALQALEIEGEVITTPFSFVATTHSLLWKRLTPRFVDIDPRTMNLDPERIRAAITPSTTAIMAVHCYGRPCDLSAIESVAREYGLKVIYDAAHAFGVRLADDNLFDHGDLSVLSFHATKVFNTFEGGAIVSPDADMKRRVDQLKNFGFVDDVTVVAAGINGKMNEFSAALGLLQLRDIDAMIERRAEIDAHYREGLRDVAGIELTGPSQAARPNHSYFPILVGPDFPLSRDALYKRLRDNDVFARRYFYPLISTFGMYKDLPSAAPANLPEATRIASQVICLPIYPMLTADEVDRVIAVITEAARA
ncbi:DegT/DnrJ/EryC1/StrS family aminotransferase [Mesorhizobium sp. BR1-1-16]|uniref:DegT/DnrJ/EryC1/StrS family aminotransferase n=1 Tax=Mesorhizobium sp. BR1-1-16 TaxID=2876653 RepID=UPI001CCDA4FB|nr:DegT/DnrJ/EryC1/StrS family aminotransferase [Mesorhizobium sp. BR1-1-16]MBZ9937690.1 DegT/DnrJ/EryC1/StrS family aminotransferase [Mesorhizobium sp. BR1-1-16]